MSSEQEESADHPNESNTNLNMPTEAQSLDTKDNGPNEHAKPKRRRRGKKRKHKKESAATCEAENQEECESELHAESEHEAHADGESPTWESDEDLSCDFNTYTDVIIRPINVPKAPENSTQFIMDDHNDCHFYMSFETPNPYLTDPPHVDGESDIIEPVGEDAAYRDIDYQYESPQDFDNSAYYDREFELSYKSNRFDELMRLSRTELISALQSLESRLKELSDDLVKENPSPILEKLQAELLELQEKHGCLKDYNSKLAALLQNETDCSINNTSEALPENPSVSHEERGSHEEDSESKVCELCSEPAGEIAMSDINPNSDKPNETCDTNSNDSHIDSKRTGDKVLTDIEKCIKRAPSSTTVNNSEEEQTKINNSNCHVHCQPNSIVNDEVRTLSMNNSDVFHIAKPTKCSSMVALEGGMSSSETSVN